jgi:hypothetical protein
VGKAPFTPRGGDPTFDGYLATQERNLQQIRRLPQFGLLEALHALYERSISVVSRDPHFYVVQLLFVCHQALLSAAATTARALPRDTIGITRRAIEAACLARAIKHDEKNLERWLAFDKRMSRWSDRQHRLSAQPYSRRVAPG